MSYAHPPSPLANLEGLNRQTAWITAGLLLIGLLACALLNAKGAFLLVGLLGLLLASPVLLRMDVQLFWSWVFAYPLLYGFQVIPVLYLLLPASLPTVFRSFVSLGEAHRALIPHVTFPLWCLLAGYVGNLPNAQHILKPEWLLRDIGAVLVILWMMAWAWQRMQERPRFKKTVFLGLVCMGMINGGVILLQKALNIGVIHVGGVTKFARPMGLFSHPNPAGYDVLLAIGLVLFGYFSASTLRGRLIYSVCLIILLTACLVTMSKTSIVQLLPLLGVWFCFLPGPTKLRAFALAAGAGVLFMGWSTFVDNGAFWEKLVMRFSKSDTLEIRQRYWHILFDNMDAWSLVWGHGYRSSTEALGVYNYQYALFQADLASDRGPWTIHPHNAYIKYLFEHGIWAMAVFGGYLALLLRSFVGIFRPPQTNSYVSRRKAIRQRLAQVGILSLVMVFLIEATTEILGLDQLYALLYLSMSILVLAVYAGWLPRGRFNRLSTPASAPAEHRD